MTTTYVNVWDAFLLSSAQPVGYNEYPGPRNQFISERWKKNHFNVQVGVSW